MDSYHVYWLLDELQALVKNEVINEETARKIAAYYAPQSESSSGTGPAAAVPASSGAGVVDDGPVPVGASPAVPPPAPGVKKGRQDVGKKKALLTVASIPVLLSVTAAVLISAGVISLIAYNWSAIPRTAKAVFAFVLLLAIQTGGSFVFVQSGMKQGRFSKDSWREGVAVLWSLMFGGVVAFISQICRLPGDTTSFLLVWSVSSILLTYAMQSVGAFVISLLLSASYVVSCGSGGGMALLFYLLFAALCPFSLRFKYGSRIMLLFSAAMLGFALDKSMPGLWTVCSVSLAVLGLEFALSRNYRRLATLSAAGLCILLLVLANDWVWTGIGWQNIRGAHSIVGIVTDIVLAVGLTGAAVAWPFVTRLCGRRPPRWQLAYPFCALAVFVLFFVYSFFPRETQRALCLAPTVVVLLFSVLFLAHVLHSKMAYSLFLLFFLCCSSLIAGLNLPVFAVALLLLLLEATGTFPSSVMRGAVFVLLLAATACMVLEPSQSWHGASMLHYALFEPRALRWQVALYALYLLAAVCLFMRKGTSLAKSADIAVSCVAVILLSALDMAFGLGKDQLCMCYFFLVLLASAYHLLGRQDGEARELDVYVLPFAALACYFFWAAAFVMKLNCPALSVSAFLLLFEAVGRYRASRDGGKEENACVYVVSRVLTVAWMLAALFMSADGSALAVYERHSLPFQAVSCACVVLVALVLFVLSRGWKESLDMILLLAAVLLLCVWCDSVKADDDSRVLMFLLLFVSAGLYAFIRFRWQGRRAWLPYLLAFVAVIVIVLYENTGRVFLCSPLIPLFAALYFYGRERGSVSGGKLSGVSPHIGEVCCAVFVFASALTDGKLYGSSHLYGGGVLGLVSIYSALALYAVMALLPAVVLLCKKRMCNAVLALYSVAVLLCHAALIAKPGIKLSSAMSFFSFACVFLLAGYYIWEAYTEGKLAKANVAACYAALALVIKFFSDDYGFVAKGILFIALGIAMLLLNLLLYRVERRKKTAGEVPNEVAE